MERHGTRLDFSLLHINLVTTEHDGDVFTHALEVAVPVGHVLVRDAGRHVKHDDTALALDVVAVTQATELLLTSGVPNVEYDRTKVCVELEWVHFHTQRGDVLFFKLTRQVALHKSGLTSTTIANKDQLKVGDVLGVRHDLGVGRKKTHGAPATRKKHQRPAAGSHVTAKAAECFATHEAQGRQS